MSEPLIIQTSLTEKERDRLDRLRRRCDWLRRRIANHRGDSGLDYDRGELSALEWAIRYIDEVAAWRGEIGLTGSGRPEDRRGER